MPAKGTTASHKAQKNRVPWVGKTKIRKRRWVISFIQESLKDGGKTFGQLSGPLLTFGVSEDYLSDIIRDLLLYDGVLEQTQELDENWEEKERVYSWRQKN